MSPNTIKKVDTPIPKTGERKITLPSRIIFPYIAEPQPTPNPIITEHTANIEILLSSPRFLKSDAIIKGKRTKNFMYFTYFFKRRIINTVTTVEVVA